MLTKLNKLTPLPWLLPTTPLGQLGLLWLLNYPVFLVLFMSYAGAHTLAHDSVSIVYFIGLSFAQASAFSWLLIVAVPYGLYLASWRKLPIIFLASCCAILSLGYLIIDSFTYSQFHTHLNWTLFSMLLGPARTQIFDLSWLEYSCLTLILFTLIGFECYLHKLQRYLGYRALNMSLILQFASLLLILVTQVTYAWADATYDLRILLASELSPGFKGATAKRFLARHGFVDTSKRPVNFSQLSSTQLNYPRQTLALTQLKNKPNILIIAIDSWRYDSLNKASTPAISLFARKASHYENHYSGGNSTRAGIFSLFYSVSPTEFDNFYRAGRGPVLFDVLYKQGYQIGIYPSASALSPPFHRTTFVNVANFDPSTPGSNSEERDQVVTQRVKAFIKKARHTKQPYFAFVFYDSVHAYNNFKASANASLQSKIKHSHLHFGGTKQRQLYYDQYRSALHFVDALIGDVLHDIQAQDLDNTVIIITADHGEEFDDNGLGYWGHNGNFTPIQTHVPLLVYWPGQIKKISYQHVTSHYDIVPTLLKQILGVKNLPGDFSLGLLLDNPKARQIILMASYGRMAIYIPHLAMLAVTNRLGLFYVENLQGHPLTHVSIPAYFYKLAFAQINQFHARILPRTDARRALEKIKS